ncbi:hypothetical protein ACFQ6V_11465 [Streptomyces roseifaciens]
MLIAVGYAALEATAEAVLGPLLRTKKERQALQDEKAQILDVLKADRAVADGPFRSGLATGPLRIRFHDGSWLRLTAVESVRDSLRS